MDSSFDIRGSDSRDPKKGDWRGTSDFDRPYVCTGPMIANASILPCTATGNRRTMLLEGIRFQALRAPGAREPVTMY
jgi:hypothetical protein